MSSLESTACPKCGAARERALPHGSCPSCGLLLERWPSFDGRPAPHPLLDPAFEALGARWGEMAAHDAFLTLARGEGELEAAAQRYHQRLRAAPDDAQARRALEQILLFAVHQQDAIPHGSVDGLRRLRLAATLAAFLLLACAGTVLWRLVVRTFSHGS